MNRTRNVRVFARAMAPALLLSAGCMVPGVSVDLVDTITETRTVELGNAESVDVFLDTSIGNFEVQGGAGGLMEAEFTYNIAEWKPTIDYSETGTKGVLTLKQPDLESKSVPNGAKNEWKVRLAADVDMSIFLDSGVGEVTMNLASIALVRLDVDQGVGSIDIDVGTDITDDTDVNIDGGIGEIVLTLPDGVGVRVEADMGIGSFSAPGLSKRNGFYVNPTYGEAEVNVRVNIDAGIGSVLVRTGEGGRASV